MDLLRLATACFALLPLDVVAVPSPRAPAPAGGAGRGACAQKNDGGEGTVCRTRIAGAQALQLPYLLLRACVQGTGQGGGAGVDLPDGGTAPEVAITLPDADPMVLFAAGAAADLFPTFEPDLLSIGGGVELGGGGRGLFQGGSDSLTVAEDISGVYGGGDGRYWPGRARCAAGVLPCLPRSAAHCSPSLSPSLAHPPLSFAHSCSSAELFGSKWSGPGDDERFEVPDHIDRRFSIELERLRSAAGAEAVAKPGEGLFFQPPPGEEGYAPGLCGWWVWGHRYLSGASAGAVLSCCWQA